MRASIGGYAAQTHSLPARSDAISNGACSPGIKTMPGRVSEPIPAPWILSPAGATLWAGGGTTPPAWRPAHPASSNAAGSQRESRQCRDEDGRRMMVPPNGNTAMVLPPVHENARPCSNGARRLPRIRRRCYY